MTREQMIEKLMRLEIGVKIKRNEKIYTLMGIKDMGGKLNRRDVGLLEEGLPLHYFVEGRYHAAGKMIKQTNLQLTTMLAQKMYMDFEVIE